jgi:hypothetical protein
MKTMTIIVKIYFEVQSFKIGWMFPKNLFWLDVFVKACKYIIIEEKFTKILYLFQSDMHNLICKNV